MKLLHLKGGDDVFEINFEFKWNCSEIFLFFQNFGDKILQKHLLCISSELLE